MIWDYRNKSPKQNYNNLKIDESELFNKWFSKNWHKYVNPTKCDNSDKCTNSRLHKSDKLY